MATIITKNSSTASSVPLNTQLVQGELAVNVTDKRLFTENASGTVVELGTNPSSLTLPNGTANGVAYLNGSKVLTTGSALTFDGSSLVGTGKFQSQVLRVKDASYSELYFSTADTGGNGAISYNHSANAMAFYANGSERMRLDSSGNLGLGVTPSAWDSNWKAMQFGPGGSMAAYAFDNGVVWGTNFYNNAGWKFKGTGYASQFGALNAGGFAWYNSTASGTAGNAISFTQAMTLNANGQLLLGTTSAGTTDAPLIVSNAGAVGMEFSPTAISGENRLLSYNRSGSSYAGFTLSAADIKFQTGGSERARIDSSGNLLVGVTDYTSYPSTSSWSKLGVGGNATLMLHGYGGSHTQVSFRHNGSTQVGTIVTTASTTAYNTSSDYRLKENIQPMTGALAKVAALKPCTYKWKSDGSDGEGFIAHELAEVVPQCVTGEKDAVDEEGNPVYQGIDTSFLVATLTAAIQEQQAIINAQSAALEQLKADVAALKGAA